MYFINKCYWYKWIEMDNMYIVNVIYFILNGGGDVEVKLFEII